MRSSFRPWFVLPLLLGSLLPPSGEPSTPVDPRGLYFHAWTGSSAGTEWALVHGVDGGSYRLTDMVGNGFRFSVASDGSMVIHDEGQGGSGSGAFQGADEARFDWRNWGLRFSSRMWRAPNSDAVFPILVSTPSPAVAGEERLEGTWTGRVEEISPTTGSTLRGESASVDVTVEGSVLRLDWPDSSFDQGLFVSGNEVAFRVLSKAPPGIYATAEGCATSRDQDLIGRGRIVEDELVIDLFLQTRSAVGQQIQSQRRYRLGRAP